MLTAGGNDRGGGGGSRQAGGRAPRPHPPSPHHQPAAQGYRGGSILVYHNTSVLGWFAVS